MSESTNKTPSALSDTQDVYSSPYEEVNGCLCKVHITKQGNFYVRLCNFAPKIVSELTIDDGTELTRKYRIGGVDEYGRPLPEFEIDATELEKMDWLHNHLDASLDLEIIPQVEKHVRHAMKSTARFATKKSIFTFTGWKQVNGKWEYLMPGVGAYDVQLQGKQKRYFLDADVKDFDYAELAGFFRLDLIPMEITYPCLALVFLSPLNEFLRQIGHEPKFILTLLGRTGSMKSTVAALMTSFFGSFSATDLPMSFRDTANSITHSAFSLKDVLTCVDDYHPTGRKESESMKAIMQTVARGYGDRAARNRLTPEITLREARPPQGNVIVTAEFAPDIGESGTARLFCIEMKPGQINLPHLTELQERAAKGQLTHMMYAYTEWMKETYLCDDDRYARFLEMLAEEYQNERACWRATLREKKVKFHDRIPDTLACLQLGFNYVMGFLLHSGVLMQRDVDEITERFTTIMFNHAANQSKAVEQDRPTHIFIRKLLAMLDCGQVCVVPASDCDGLLPSGCLGYEDEEHYYLFFESTQRAVKKFCDDQGEGFTISTKALGKALADEGFINTDTGENTRTMRFGSKTKRVLLLRKEMVEKVMGI
mgnify:FL=1